MPGLKRAYVLIGVKKAKTLPELQAVWENVAEMREWAESQGAKARDVIAITDEETPVTADRIYQAISSLCDLGTIDQLVVYFSGHGVNSARSEFWLLSDAVENPNAAVNLSGSMDLARYGVIPHVVFISDACRTAASGIQAQSVIGQSIFPVKSSPTGARFIDVFYGTAIGDPSYEVEDIDEAVAGYRAVYTDALVFALKGHYADILKRSEDNKTDLVCPWPLHEFLKRHVAGSLYDLGIKDKYQTPDAIISSRDDAYLSALPVDRQKSTLESDGRSEEATEFADVLLKEMAFASDATQRVIDDARTVDIVSIHDDITRTTSPWPEGLEPIKAEKIRFADEVRETFKDFGPKTLPNQRGLKVRGAKVVDAVAAGVETKVSESGSVVEFSTRGPTIANVLVVVESGHGVVIPGLQGYFAGLTFDQEVMTDLSFVPDEASDRYHAYERRQKEIHGLRTVIAASSRRGRFRLGKGDEELARRMQLGKSVDPGLALYAAHAYREQGNERWLNEMAGFLRRDLKVDLFDVALLSSTPEKKFPHSEMRRLAPFAPLMSQSWPILQVRKHDPPARLRGIEQHTIKTSLWTVYTPEGVDLIRQSIQKGEIQ